MRFSRLVGFCLLFALLFNHFTYAQNLLPGEPVAVQTAPAEQVPSLSPGATEMAKQLGLISQIERLYRLPESERGSGAVMSIEALSLRQDITEAVIACSLEVDGIIAEIDGEVSQVTAIRDQLESRRDHALTLNTIANIVASGFGGIVGTALQFNNSTANLGNGIGVVGAGVSTVLSMIGLRQQRGGKGSLGVAPNLLAKLFDKKPEFHSDYPTEVWTYLNAVPPTDQRKETRRALLIKRWTELGHIDPAATPKAQRKIELLTSSISQQNQLTIDLLNDRAAMLADVRAVVSLMKRDLSKLVLALRPQRVQEKQ